MSEITKNNSEKKIKFLYLGGVFIVLGLFCLLLYKQFANIYYENDLWWYIPSMFHHLKTMTGQELIKLMVFPEPVMYAVPSAKMYPLFVLAFFGSNTGNFICVSLVIFFLSSFLLYNLVKKLTGNYQISIISAIVFASSYVHFSAYMWPIAIQHLLIVFFTLLTLNLYIVTDLRQIHGSKYKLFYTSTLLANFFASFLCRINIAILPVIILAHILFCSKDAKDCFNKYKVWIPLFLTYLFYPVITLIFIGDHKLGMPVIQLPKLLSFSVFFSIGTVGIFTFKGILKHCNDKIFGVIKYSFISLSVVILCLLRARLDIVKYLMLPYAVLFHIGGSLRTFLEPFSNVLTSNSTLPFYAMHLSSSFFTLLLGLVFVGLFLKQSRKKRGLMAIFLTWYIFILFHLCFSNPTGSRYFIYITPIISVIFSSGLYYGYSFFADKIKLAKFWKETFLILIVLIFSFANIYAIRFRMQRDKFTNTFFIYDYIRSANIIRDDFPKKIKDISAHKIYINNVLGMEVKRRCSFVPFDSENYYNFRFALAQTFGSNDVFGVNINNNLSQVSRDYSLYKIEGHRIYDRTGKNIDLFSQLFEQGKKLLNVDNKSATETFLSAVTQRPFLLNYILGPKADLSDLKWICSDNDLRTWVDKIINREGSYRGERLDKIFELINQEIDEYIQCLFFLSYLNYISGNISESQYWFNQIGLFESNFNSIVAELREVPIVKNNKAMLSFLGKCDNSLWYSTANWDKIGFLRFERFLLKDIFNMRSSKDSSGV